MQVRTLFLLAVLMFVLNTTAAGNNSCISKADTLKPEVGKSMPDFALRDIRYYKQTKASLPDFKGKWLVLDFWFAGCVVCIKSFPKVNALQAAFKNEVQFMLVGMNGSRFGIGIEKLFERLREKQDLKHLPVAYDSVLNVKWEINAMPHLIIIDPNGIVRHITDGRDLDEAKLRSIIAGDSVNLFLNPNQERPEFDGSSTIDTGSPLIYRSSLSAWSGERQVVPEMSYFFKYLDKPIMRFSAVPLTGLYNLAFIGKWVWSPRDSLYDKVYPYPVLEISDRAAFQFDRHFVNRQGIYNYALIVPESQWNKELVMKVMQRELETLFGYKASVEARMVPVWKLIAMPGAFQKLKSNSNVLKYSDNTGSGGVAGFTLEGATTDMLLGRIRRYISDGQPPFFNETGIKEKIDISIDALLTDREAIRKALRENGLDLVLSPRVMFVVVIKE